VRARVLAFDGVSDTIEVLGRRVTADLPPSFRPGDTLSLEIIGFDGDRLIAHAIERIEPDEQHSSPAPDTASASAQKFQKTPGVNSLEARIAAARTTLGKPGGIPPPLPPPVAVPGGGSSKPPPSYASALAARYTRAAPGAPVAQANTATPVAAAASAARAGTASDSATLLRALNVPATPRELAAANLVQQNSVRIATSLAHLDDVLRKTAVDGSADDHNTVQARPLPSLRAIAGFLRSLDAQSPELATQLAAYADHVLGGREAKLAAIFQSLAASDGPAGHSAAPLALTHDLKTLLLQALASRNEKGDAAHTAIREALTAVSAAQLASLTDKASDPGTVAFSIPLHSDGQTHTVRLRVRRDPPQGARKLDGDNFHIAFVLDTEHLGTIAIDIESVGRTLRMLARAERQAAASRIEQSLPALCEQFRKMRYEVAAASAAVLPHTDQAAATAPAPAPAAEPLAESQHALFDRRA
jgi:hypothetical protein